MKKFCVIEIYSCLKLYFDFFDFNDNLFWYCCLKSFIILVSFNFFHSSLIKNDFSSI
jgi:hypothetical protein